MTVNVMILENSIADDFKWLNPPKHYQLDENGITIRPFAQTDFIRSYNSTVVDNASFYFTQVEGDFCLQAEVHCLLVGKYDAGALMIRSDEEHWAKLCIERCADDGISIVSVVTNTWSDDTNNECLASAHCHLRVIRQGDLIAFHYSLDGKVWRFVRKFPINWRETLQVGVAAQAPFVDGAEIEFSHIQLGSNTISNFRDGS
ncbi:hypothetical protein BIY21_00380 [Vibrio ponticus]|uniref:DUF1349 domain-containing protein n=2 Tax=Vibrio ponticus TaxID=265668 RepID=A0ABX3FKI6_9VIBR|nr:DUF1349 domain-containing protein [Vibrio ponticus]OLQ94290.1 hypothetical protein BIY21_00380 [Vibrio ponticus]